MNGGTRIQVADTINVPEQIYSMRNRALTIWLGWCYSHSGFWVLKYFKVLKTPHLSPVSFSIHLFLKFVFKALKERCMNVIKYYLKATNQSKMQSWWLWDFTKVYNVSLKTLNEQVSPWQHVPVQHLCRAGTRCTKRAGNSPQTLVHIEPLSPCTWKTLRPLLFQQCLPPSHLLQCEVSLQSCAGKEYCHAVLSLRPVL